MTVYTLFGQALPGNQATGASAGTFAVMFKLSASAALTGIWHYSGSGETVLPSATAVWDNATGVIVSGTQNNTPSWSGAAGSGWVKVTYNGSVTLDTRAGGYAAGFFTSNSHTYSNSGASAWPVTSGILTAPATGTINSVALNNGPFNTAGALGTPNGSDATTDFNWLADVEVTAGTAHTDTAALTLSDTRTNTQVHGHNPLASLAVAPGRANVIAYGKNPKLVLVPVLSAVPSGGSKRKGGPDRHRWWRP